MSKTTIIVTAVAALGTSIFFAGCQGNVAVNQNTNSAPATTPPAQSEIAPVVSAEKTDLATASPAEVYKAAYAARQKKDVATLKKLFSKDILEFFAEIGKDEKKSADDMILEMCNDPQGKSDEIRDLKINGDKATAQYADAKDEWRTIDFIKEGGSWKMTLDGPGPGKKDKK